jgi:cadmium resistance protein CadD (predicted permease)
MISKQSYSVAAVTIANGSDNIGVYIPLFARGSAIQTTIIALVFFTLIAVWCYVAYNLVNHPTVADILERYGGIVLPFVLIILGITIMNDSGSLDLIRNLIG